MLTNNWRVLSSVVNGVLVRNSLLLIAFSLILLFPAARETFASILLCVGCSCYSQGSDTFEASCTATMYCWPEDYLGWVYVASTKTCPNQPVLNTASTAGAVGGNSIGGQANSIALIYSRLCQSGWATNWCNGLRGSGQFIDGDCCSPPPPPPPPPACEEDPYCNGVWDYELCECREVTETQSPILIAVGTSAEYRLVGTDNGVWFDHDADGTLDHTAWTSYDSELAFLVADKNGNGRVDDGTELFGNNSRLSSGQAATDGFHALAEYDRSDLGGNLDGWIDARDGIWAGLMLWIDRNHNGRSDDGELFRPQDMGVSAISLEVTSERRRDRYGNFFRLKAPAVVNGTRRFSYDVNFRVSP